MNLLTITQKNSKMSQKNKSTYGTMTLLQLPDHAALRDSVMQWKLEVIKNALTVFGIAINRKLHEMIKQ